MIQEAICLNQVRKSFGHTEVLKGISLSVPQNSVYAFLGNNGEGKSTTIRILTGLLAADSGEITILGKNIAKQPILIKKELGCLVDSPALYPQLTAREFLKIGCTLKNLPVIEIDKVLSLVSLEKAQNSKINKFSLGMKQRLALAHALLGTPKLLILDEPTNGLDPQGILEIRHLIKQLPKRFNCTVFVSSHMLDEVEKIATHVALLNAGHVINQSTIENIDSNNIGQLNLVVNDVATALSILRRQGFNADIVDSQNLIVKSINELHTHHVNRLLTFSGIQLFQSVYKKPTLESWFLQSTQLN